MGMRRAEVGQGCEGLKGRGSHCRYQVWEEKRLRDEGAAQGDWKEEIWREKR